MENEVWIINIYRIKYDFFFDLKVYVNFKHQKNQTDLIWN